MAVADLAPGQLAGSPRSEKRRRKGREGKEEEEAVSRPEEAGLPGVGGLSTAQKEDREERRETHQCHAGGDLRPVAATTARRQHLWDRGRRLTPLSRWSAEPGTSEAALSSAKEAGVPSFLDSKLSAGDALRGGAAREDPGSL